MLSPAIRAVFFDAVGTVIHPVPSAAEVYAAVGRRFGSRLTAAEIAPRFLEAFRAEEIKDRSNGLRTSEAREMDRWQAIVQAVFQDSALAAACFPELFEHFARPQAWCCEPDAGPVLAELSGIGCTLGLASNYDSRLRRVVAGLPPLRPVQHLVISSEVGWRKPAPQFFAAVCRLTGLAPGQVLLVGDAWADDCEGGRAAGLRAVLFDPRERKKGPGVTRISRLGELLA